MSIFNADSQNYVNENFEETTPKYRFCWHCGKQLRANFHREYKENGHTYIVHAQCLRELETGENYAHAIDDKEFEMLNEFWG